MPEGGPYIDAAHLVSCKLMIEINRDAKVICKQSFTVSNVLTFGFVSLLQILQTVTSIIITDDLLFTNTGKTPQRLTRNEFKFKEGVHSTNKYDYVTFGS